MPKRLIALSLLLLMIPISAPSADAYLVRFRSIIRVETGYSMMWADFVQFYNRGTSPATVKVLGMSDGTPSSTSPDSFTVPPGRVLRLDFALNGAWSPREVHLEDTALYTLHLDIPPGVIVDSRDEVYLRMDFIGSSFFYPQGHASMPVFDGLTPSNVPQVHLGSDLGVRQSRTNAIIYNAGSVAATAHVELRRTCDDSVDDQRSVLIPPNSTTQIAGLSAHVGGGCDHNRYTVVTVDQPSLSLVSNVTKSTPDSVTGRTPTIDVSVSHPRQF